MAKIRAVEADLSTEEKIKEAARKVFTQKGYHGTKTRDIAEEAGINLALLNYYFRTKDKLFELVVREIIEGFVGNLKGIFNNEQTSVIEKFRLLSDHYAQTLTVNPHIPLFILSELQINPDGFIKNYQVDRLLAQTYFFKQLVDGHKSGKITVAPIDLLINFISLTIFPFAAKAMITAAMGLSEADYQENIKHRKNMIPAWIEKMFMN
jgi:AcrR family transcriptional regulator